MQQPSRIDPLPAFNQAERILDTLASAILCLDGERRIRYANSAAEALFENSATSLYGRLLTDLLSSLEPSSIVDKLGLDVFSFTEHEAAITLASGKSIVANYSIYPFGQQADGI